MDLANVSVFVHAVRLGSLAAASRHIGLAPMATSRRLAALEGELGKRLLHRTTRALSLTAEGETFLPHALAMLDHAEAAVRDLGDASGGARGCLRVTASGPFGRKMISPILPDLLRDNPDLSVDLDLSDRVEDIVSKGWDVAIRIAPLRENGLVAKRLAASPRVLCAAPSYIADHPAPSVVSDLAGHDCLVTSGTRHWSFVRAGDSIQQVVAGPIASSSLEVLHDACLRGLGIGQFSTWYIAEDLAAGRLVPIALGDATCRALDIWAVYPSASMVPQRVRVFITALSHRLASEAGDVQL